MKVQYAVGQLFASQVLQQAIASGWAVLDQQQAVSRIWRYDATLWKSDPAVQEKIRERLGWLTVATTMQEKCDEIAALVNQVRQAGYTHAILLGIGGSSLCPQVLRLTFGVAPGYLDLFVLDTTDPDTIHALEQQIDLNTTLFIVASKSGSTIETLSQYGYFFDEERQLLGAKAGEHFIAITDPGTPLEQLAREHHFRHTFLNPPDIGGRYSALSFFGLVPAALIGVDIAALLASAQEAMSLCETQQPQSNPALWLGAILGILGTRGHNKVTFAISPQLSSFAYWAEQLLAESTGKDGHGLLPVEGEPLAEPDTYANDRLFVYLRLQDDDNTALDSAVQTLHHAGHPVVQIDLKDSYQLGAEFFRWELATVVSALFLDINPLDEPNVQESKNNTRHILDQYQQKRRLPEPEPVLTYNTTRIIGKTPAGQALSQAPDLQTPHILLYGKDNATQTLADYLHAFLGQVRTGDYIALMAYVQHTHETEVALQALRLHLRNTYTVATTLGYGPRFLHSTGQLHKGGTNNGVFIQITDDIHNDIAIPGEPYTFGVLRDAQALGDLFSLDHHQRRYLRLHISGDLVAGLHIVKQLL